MNAQQAMEYLDKIAEEEQEEVNAEFTELFGGRTLKDMFTYLYFEIDPSKLNKADRAKFYETAYGMTKSQLPILFGGIDE